MLMVGAAGRNQGKTEFICRVISMQRDNLPVTGIKITAFDGDLTQGKDYLNLQGNFLVTREVLADGEKDTHRMCRAGAESVYWLRTKRSHLTDGLATLFQGMERDGINPETACLIAEAVCARSVIDPGLYLIIREPGESMKPSCAETAHLADLQLNPLGNGWDPTIERLSFENSHWVLR